MIAALLEAGASDAWLTPILMKKGRPAHTLLGAGRGRPRATACERPICRQTSTIGVRETTLGKHALDREMVSVEVAGQPIAVKLARHDGAMRQRPAGVRRRRRARPPPSGRPVNDVLADAIAATRALLKA